MLPQVYLSVRVLFVYSTNLLGRMGPELYSYEIAVGPELLWHQWPPCAQTSIKFIKNLTDEKTSKQETITSAATSPSWSIMKANHHSHWRLIITASGKEHIVVSGV